MLTERPLFLAAREGTALGPVGRPFAGANPWGGCQLLVREDPAQTRTAPALVWVEGQASIFPTPLSGGSYFQGLFLPGIHVPKPSPGPLGSPLFPSPTSSHQALSLLCLGHLPNCPLCPHLVQAATSPAWTSSPASAGVSLLPTGSKGQVLPPSKSPLWLLTARVTSKLYLFKKQFFWQCHTACGILVTRPGIEPMSPAVEAQSPNHWTAREVPTPRL